MSNGRSEDDEGDFKEISLDHQTESSQSDQSNQIFHQNLDTSDPKESSENNRNNYNNQIYDSAYTSESATYNAETHITESTQTQPNLNSSTQDTDLQNLKQNYSYYDETQEIRSPENTSRFPPHPNFNYMANYSSNIANLDVNRLRSFDITHPEYGDDQKPLHGYEDMPVHHPYQSTLDYETEFKKFPPELYGKLTGLRDYNPEHTGDQLNESPIEYNLSDQSQEQTSDAGLDAGSSDPEVSPQPESKLKHRKRFKTTSKTLESLFHKSSGKAAKAKAATVPTSPGTLDNLVVTTSTSTSTMTNSKRKDKGPTWTNYEIPNKPSRKGPTLGVFYDSLKSTKMCQKSDNAKDHRCIVLQTPDSLERYLHPFHASSNYYQNANYIKYYNAGASDSDGVMTNYYFINMMAQRKSLLPYYVTKTIFGNVPGMGRVLVCGTQCGKIIFYNFFSLDELLVLDTRSVYDKYLSRENSIDSEADFDINKAIDSTLFEINCLSLISTFHDYSHLIAVGNHLGHVLLYQIPKLQLVKLIYPTTVAASAELADDGEPTTHPSISTAQSFNTLETIDSLDTELDDPLIDDLELLKIRRYKNAMSPHGTPDGPGSDAEEFDFISCLGYCPATGDLWVGYGNGNFAIYNYKFKLKRFYNANHLNAGNAANIIVEEGVYSVNNFEFCSHEHIVLVLYGNVKVDIFNFEGAFLSTISATRLTNSSIPISTINVWSAPSNSAILYIGLMDGSLLVKQILYTTNGASPIKDRKESGVNDDDDVLVELLSNSIEFILLYNLSYKIDGELNFGAPVTSICPVPSQNLVLLGNASGGLSVISKLEV